MQEQRNMKEARDNHGYVAPLTTSVLDGSKQGKGELGDTLAVVQRSTASMGKFDKRRKGEEAIKAPRGKRHKVFHLLCGHHGVEQGAATRSVQLLVLKMN